MIILLKNQKDVIVRYSGFNSHLIYLLYFKFTKDSSITQVFSHFSL